jgi:hypothetical protein
VLRRALPGILVLGLLLFGAPVARAELPVTCAPGQSWDGQKCQILVTVPVQTGGGQSLAGNGGDSSTPRTCLYSGVVMPCQDPTLGWWSDSRSCYVQATSPQPAVSAPAWTGHTDGAIYDCALPRQGALGGLVYQFWSATAPVGPDPVALAKTAIATMNLKPISIGIVPDSKPGSVGLVGLPVWMWVANPDQQTWGPVTKTASAGGVTVTATAKVQRVRWLMGEGGVVVCTSAGTVYEDRFGKLSSPTCGYKYHKQGVFTVHAESLWVVSWSGVGLNGTIPVTLTQSTTLTIGEMQVITIG